MDDLNDDDDCDLNNNDSNLNDNGITIEDDDDDDVIVVGEKRARGKMNSLYSDVHGLNLMLLTEETSTLESAKRARLEPTVPAPRSEAESSEFYLLLQFTHHDN